MPSIRSGGNESLREVQVTVTAEIAPPTEVSIEPVFYETLTAFTIPAGQRYVRIYVAGAVVPGDGEGPAVIDGETVNTGFLYEFKPNPQTNEYFTTTEITGNAQGTRVHVLYWE